MRLPVRAREIDDKSHAPLPCSLETPVSTPAGSPDRLRAVSWALSAGSSRELSSRESAVPPLTDKFSLRPMLKSGGEPASLTSSVRSGGSGPPFLGARLHKFRRVFRSALGTPLFKGTAMAALFVALFGSPLCLILDLPDDPWIPILDAIMTCVMVLFLAEQVMRSVADPGYPLSFFFFMDLIGTASMVFDISYMLGKAGKQQTVDEGVQLVLMRTARAAKVAARAVRLSKIVKCVSIFYGGRRGREDEDSKHRGADAKDLNAKLMMTLSTKVAMLTVVLVLGVPVFSIWRYPEDDLSMRSWSRRLEADYAHSYEIRSQDLNATGRLTSLFEGTVQDLVAFYSDLSYSPFSIEGYPEELTIDSRRFSIPGESALQGEAPARQENVLRQMLSTCALPRPACENGGKPSISFDFSKANQFGAGMDVCVILFIIACMMIEAYDISQTLAVMVVKPIEKMLSTVYEMANVLTEVTMLVGEGSESDGHGESHMTEAEMLEKVFKRLAKLTTVFLEAGPLSEREMEGMDHESKGVIVDIMGINHPTPSLAAARERVALRPTGEDVPWKGSLESWELDLLNMEDGERRQVLLYIFYDSDLGSRTGRAFADMEKCRRFHEAVSLGYNENPYHNFAHACDVVASCNRLLQQVQWTRWLSNLDAFAILVAAVSHDIGHTGRTNPFLIETMDDLALRYNDKSPLENMHCARLFQILGVPQSNIFDKLSRDDYKRARMICILAILGTDNALHFDMVKDVKKAYEVSSTVCDLQARHADEFLDQYIDEVLCKNTLLWIKLFMHMADIANPLKPFAVYKMWAACIMEEFFSQGDEEKRLGIPVGMLNDRDKVSQPGAEHGFINFLAAPLVTSSVSVFPVLLPLAVQMTTNMEMWRNLWVEQAQPSLEDVRKRDLDIVKIREQVEMLQGRAVPGSQRVLWTSSRPSRRRTTPITVADPPSKQ